MLKVVEIRSKKKDTLNRDILKSQGELLRTKYLKHSSPIKDGIMRDGWKLIIVNDNTARVMNQATNADGKFYLPFVREYYKRRAAYDFVLGPVNEWLKDATPHPPLKPPKLKFKIKILPNAYPLPDDGQYKPVASHFKMMTTDNTVLSKQEWDKASKELLSYLLSVSPVDTGAMASDWNRHFVGDGVIFRNKTKYLAFVRGYYMENRGYDFTRDAILDFNLGLPKQPRLRPVGRFA
jgi:hypothetical protein